jgi:leader peptidase (prepilin peptidase)/N-methyltransferase
MIHILGTLAAALAGVFFGGVLNASLDAWTAREGPQTEPVICRKCRAIVPLSSPAWSSNWYALRHRCPQCGALSALRYPLVALAVGATWAIAAWQALPALYLPGWAGISVFDSLVFGAVKMTLCWLLIGLAVMDAESRWLPDWFTLGGAALGLALSFGRFAVFAVWQSIPLHWSVDFGSHGQHLFEAILRWIVGMLALPAIVLLVKTSYQRLRKQEGVRAGEAKVILLLAAWLGLSHTVLASVIGVLLAAVAVLVLVVRKGMTGAWMTSVPVATFLCVGGIVSGLWGGALIEAYLRWCGFE